MNSSNPTPNQSLAQEIMNELGRISDDFSSFQNSTGLVCPSGCGKCCFKSDIYCTPIELLPMAMAIYKKGEALQMLEKCHNHMEDHCLFMNVQDKKNGKGRCTEYDHRPLVCRAFGVAPKHDKNGKMNFSVCTTLKETNVKDYSRLLVTHFENEKIPFIDQSKNKLSTLDPRFMEEEFPINKSLAIMLEKILFFESFNSSEENPL